MSASSIYSQEEWQQHVKAYHNGKLKRVAYCKLHNIKYHQFGYWLKKFKPKSPLVPIRIKPELDKELSQTALTVLGTLQLKQGILLKIHDLNALTAILRAYAHAV